MSKRQQESQVQRPGQANGETGFISILASLGQARIPLERLGVGAFCMGVADDDWRKWTGVFPKTMRHDKDTHPLYVAEANGLTQLVWPASTKCSSRPALCIPRGTELEHTGYRMEKTSYLLRQYGLRLGQEKLKYKPLCMGVIAPDRLVTEK